MEIGKTFCGRTDVRTDVRTDGRTHLSSTLLGHRLGDDLKIVAHWAKGAQNGGKKGAFFVAGTLKLFFFCSNGTDLHEIRAKNQLVSSIES